MKVYVYPADIHGCGFLRMIWPARALAAAGHEVVLVMPDGAVDAFGRPYPASGLKGHVDADGKTVAVTMPKDADVMVLQRVTHRALAEAVPIWQKRGVAVVIDMDDDLSSIHPTNPAWRALHPTEGKPGFSWRVAEQACRDATLVTTSTPALAQRYAPHGRSAVLYNCVPERYLTIPHEDSNVIGWGGSVLSHPDDLQAMGTSVARIVDAGAAALRIVGPGDGVEYALGLGVSRNWSASGGVNIGQWPNQLASDIGIGIAPLADTRFNESKSWLKPLEYAALGIPCVMSPRAEYQRLHELGVGRLAAKPREWERTLRALAVDATQRAELSEAGRAVAAGLTIERNAWWWMSAWEEAYRIQRGALARAS